MSLALPTAFGSIETSAFAAAYELRLPAMMALKNNQLASLNVAPNAAVTTVLAALPKIAQFRPRLIALDELNESLLRNLEHDALAAAEANSRFIVAAAKNDAAGLNRQAVKMRRLLRLDVQALVQRGLIDRARLESFKSFVGYKNVAFELIDYANLLNGCWPQIEGRTAVRKEEIQRAKQLGERLVVAAGESKTGRRARREAAQIRRRAMTLLFRSYREVRRAVAFLRRREGDVDAIAPSLYAGRGGRGKSTATVARHEPMDG